MAKVGLLAPSRLCIYVNNISLTTYTNIQSRKKHPLIRQLAAYFKWRISTKLAAGLRSVARNYKATRLLTRPG